MLPVSHKSNSVNECIKEINKLIKSHILGVWQNVDEFISQLANMQSWVHNQSVSANSVDVMKFNGDTPSTRHSLLDKITASNNAVT